MKVLVCKYSEKRNIIVKKIQTRIFSFFCVLTIQEDKICGKKQKEIIKIENEENIISDDFYLEIKSLINEARRRVLNYVNSTILVVYWSIGKMKVEKQGGEERAKYG